MLDVTLRQTFMDFSHSIRNTFGSIPFVSQLYVQQDNVLSERGCTMLSMPWEFIMRLERELVSEKK